MLLWVVVGFIVLSAAGVLSLTFGALRTSPQVGIFRLIAAVQFLAAVILAGARLTGNA
ncbi:hypothetical protein GCM10017783_10850 [Deinococcus piscis]|uniref:HIG1 domain-containing protein n=1 Tax=Deinococcus piscis TaxID=394230 RepID=A0ABQ3K581_9DEIO|nr:hypothetical protein [Deinococcus piscis]GHG00567.1 hypothetical protein GCM10017783_10850 [Deinococcus piscis]